MKRRYAFSDLGWQLAEQIPPRTTHGVRRIDDRRVLNDFFQVLHSGTQRPELPGCRGPRTTCYTRFI
ncbi:transposase [Roseibium album]|uniref:transposase n=1 Tax=Roseibium album TaxID=311410 RepID=UPI00391AB36F